MLMKKIAAVRMLILFLSSATFLVPTTALKIQTKRNSSIIKLNSDGGKLKIEIISYLCMVIKNVGTETVYNITVEIRYRGLYISGITDDFKFVKKIDAGKEKTLCVGGPVWWIGFGFLIMIVLAYAPHTETAKTCGVVGFMLGPLFLPLR